MLKVLLISGLPEIISIILDFSLSVITFVEKEINFHVLNQVKHKVKHSYQNIMRTSNGELCVNCKDEYVLFSF